MKRALLAVVAASLALVGGVWVTALSTPLFHAPARIQEWVPFPLACSGTRCVTYRRLAALQRATEAQEPADLLTRVLTQQASRRIARRTGLSVTNEEITSALKAVQEAVQGAPELQMFVDETYGSLDSKVIREGMRDLLLLQKLSAAGVQDLWNHQAAPSVWVLHARYRWNSPQHRVVER